MPSPRRASVLAAVAALGLLVGACTIGTGSPPPGADGIDAAPAAVPDVGESEVERDLAPAAPATACRRDALEPGPVVELLGDDTVALSLRVAHRTHRCTEIAVVAPAGAGWASALAVPVALAADAPLLLARPGDTSALTSALDVLDAARIVTVGLPSALTTREVLALDTGADDGAGLPDEVVLALTVIDHLGADQLVAVAQGDVLTAAAAASRLGPDAALLPVPDDLALLAPLAEALPATATLEVQGRDAEAAATLADRLLTVGLNAQPSQVQPDDAPPWAEGRTTTWLVDPAATDLVAVAAVAALARGDAVLPIHSGDLRADRSNTTRLRAATPHRVVVLGDITGDAAWQLPLVLDGHELPGGGFQLFEGQRIVALYGHPELPRLGALGEQDLDATVERLREVATPYEGDGWRVLPAFELVATVASEHPEPTGDYSRRTPIDTLRPWIDRAAEEGFYVVLDLQPGRTDFLDQAREFEQLLVEPHVGLALDPAWRLEDDRRHLDGTGSVDADEIQRVIDWLAQLTRREQLPQKLLVLHQHRLDTLPDRDTIQTPPELAVVIQMDGHGNLTQKRDSYLNLAAGADERWWWGWKHLSADDDPVAAPAEVLELDPQPAFVSYQ